MARDALFCLVLPSMHPCMHREMLTRFLVLLCAGTDGDAESDENSFVKVIPVILCLYSFNNFPPRSLSSSS